MSDEIGIEQEGPKKKELAEMGLNELIFRMKLVKATIRFVREQGDPHGVIDRYKEQQERIGAELKKRRWDDKGLEKPEAIAIGLKPAKIKGIVPR